MSDPNNALVKALYTTLNAALSCPFYDRPPTGATMPYVAIDTLQAVPRDPLASLRDEIFVYLTVWTKYRGAKEANEIVAEAYGALHRAKLPLDTGRMVRAYVTNRGAEPDIDEEIHKGRLTVKFIVEH